MNAKHYNRIVGVALVLLALWGVTVLLVSGFQIPHKHVYGPWQRLPSTHQFYQPQARRCLLCGWSDTTFYIYEE